MDIMGTRTGMSTFGLVKKDDKEEKCQEKH